jgi:hypothetical protein
LSDGLDQKQRRGRPFGSPLLSRDLSGAAWGHGTIAIDLGKESRDAADRDDRFAISRPRPSHDCKGDQALVRIRCRRADC